jgi:hypothetical protein
VWQLALPVLICQFFLSKYNGDTVSLLGYFRITFGRLLTGMEGALVLVVLYGVGTKVIRKVGAGWRIDLIDSTVAGRTNQRPPSPRRFLLHARPGRLAGGPMKARVTIEYDLPNGSQWASIAGPPSVDSLILYVKSWHRCGQVGGNVTMLKFHSS